MKKNRIIIIFLLIILFTNTLGVVSADSQILNVIRNLSPDTYSQNFFSIVNKSKVTIEITASLPVNLRICDYGRYSLYDSGLILEPQWYSEKNGITSDTIKINLDEGIYEVIIINENPDNCPILLILSSAEISGLFGSNIVYGVIGVAVLAFIIIASSFYTRSKKRDVSLYQDLDKKILQTEDQQLLTPQDGTGLIIVEEHPKTALSVIECVVCGEINEPDSAFCEKCGNKI